MPADRLEDFEEAKPWVRTLFAFVAWLACDAMNLDDAYAKADEFLGRLKEDLEARP